MERFRSFLITSVLVLIVSILLGSVTAKAIVKEVSLTLDGKTYFYSTIKSDVKGFLEEKNISLSNDDYINVSLNDPIKENMSILIKRAFDVKVIDNQNSQIIKMTSGVVEDALKKAGIKLETNDKVNLPLSETLKPNLIIKITRINQKIISEESKIPFSVEKRLNYRMEFGKEMVVQEGKEGVLKKTYQITYENNKEVSKKFLKSEIVKKPISKIVEVGTIRWFKTSRGEVVRYRKVYSMIATAYELSPNDTGKSPSHPDYAKTATGHRVQRGVVAVDPRVIPLGTRLYVEGYGFARALDTGSAIKGNRIDVFVEKNAEQYGRRRVNVYILAD
ncbi:G5 domain-containing protein [Caldicellulosiruptoraceae bacterium PP1]